MTHTVESVMQDLKERLEQSQPIGPSEFMEAAAKLVALAEGVDEELLLARMAVGRMKSDLMDLGKTAAHAKVSVEASAEFEKYLRLEAKRERITEMIRVAKKRAELKQW